MDDLKANKILDDIIEKEFEAIPLSAKTDFQKKMDCPQRTVALKAMLKFAFDMCDEQKQECASNAETRMIPFTDDEEVDKSTILSTPNVVKSYKND